MEFNAEQIVKALECCTRGRKSKDDRPCLECQYNECNLVGGTSERQTTGTCQGWLMKDALSLIKELTKERGEWKKMAKAYFNRYDNIVGDLVEANGQTEYREHFLRKSLEIVVKDLRKSLEKSQHDVDRYALKIKELTEEQTDHIALLLAKDVIIQDLNNEHNRLTEENERLRAENSKYEAENHAQFNKWLKLEEATKRHHAELFEEAKIAVKEDTVRKMQLEIEKRCAEGGIYPAFVASTIDQIAKEMLGVEE